MLQTMVKGDWGEWDLDANPIGLLVSPAKGMLETSLDIVGDLPHLGFKVIYISAVRPCEDIQSRLEQRDMDLSAFYFVDTVSQNVTEMKEEARCLFTRSPADLTTLSISLSAAMAAVGDRVAVFLDSITALTIHNDVRAIERFVHHLVSKVRMKKSKAVLAILDTTDPREVERFAMLCDETLEVG